MKSGSDNFRSAAIDVMGKLAARGVEILVYEPGWRGTVTTGHQVLHDLRQFKEISDVIVSNRLAPELEDVREKVYTRDVFRRD